MGTIELIPAIAALKVSFAPTDIAGLQADWDFTDITTLWKDTARTSAVTADADVILGVTDKSGTGKHLSEATNGPAYKTNIVNGQSVARFNGSSSNLRTSAFTAINQPVTTFVALKIQSVVAARTVTDGPSSHRFSAVYINSGSSRWASYYGTAVIESPTTANTSTHVLCSTGNGASSALRLDGGANIISGNPGTQTITQIGLANDTLGGGSSYMQVDILRFLLYDSDLSNADKDRAGRYLAASAGTTWTAVS